MSALSTDSLDIVHIGGGRFLKMFPPKGSHYIKAMEIAGGELTLVPLFEALMCVGFICEDPVSLNHTKLSILSLSDKIGRRGVEQVQAWYQDKMYPEINEVLNSLPDDVPKDLSNPDVKRLVDEKREAALKN